MIKRPPGPVWSVTTGEAGNISQAVGLAQAVGLPFVEKTGHLRRPWSWLPSPLASRAGLPRLLDPGSDDFSPPWPQAVIACGRRAATLSLAIRDAAQRDTGTSPCLVQILDPQVNPAHFDLVIAPDHDRLTGPNVLTSLGAIHRLTPDHLVQGAKAFKESFAGLPRPLVAVLIGGASGACRFDVKDACHLAQQLVDLVERTGVGLVVTPSRRTGQDQKDVLEKALGPRPEVIFWTGTGPNPYFGMLALADVILVTGESVSMMSEACYSGKPVYTLEMGGGSARLERFRQRLEQDGYIRPFQGDLALWTSPAPLDEARRLGDQVRKIITGTPPNSPL